MITFWICITLAGLLLTVSSGSVPETISFIEELPHHSNLSCTENETPCGLGCCPFADAECCLDGYECCEHGQVCIPYAGLCIGSGSENTLVSSEPTRVRSDLGDCPSYTTTCYGGCCLYLDATCCPDGLHCCPAGFSCDVPNKRCLPNYVFNNRIRGPLDQARRVEKMTKSVPKAFFKSCPGGVHACPKSQSCCIDDEGGWNCCPKPSSRRISTMRGAAKSTFDCCYDMNDLFVCCYYDDQFCVPGVGCI